MKKTMRFIAFFLIGLWLTTSCSDDETTPAPDENTGVPSAVQFVYDVMSEFYFWYAEIPSNVVAENYDDPVELMDDMIYTDLDRWSYIVQDDGALAEQITEGTRQGIIGVAVAYDADDNLRIVYALPEGPADQAGIKRSDIIQKLNGIVPNPDAALSFGEVPELEILSSDGSVRTVTLNRVTIQENPVLHHEVKDVNGTQVAYLVFKTFNGLAEDNLNEAFADFNAAGATELIVDLRYNGGGLVSAAQHFASLMVPSANYGDVFIAEEFNDKNTRFNDTLLFEDKEQNLSSINRVVFIVGPGTASASELVINGLKPYIDVTLVGQQTNGKYVGASLFEFEDYTFIPITFQSANANGEVFINGFLPEIAANDDITHDFGDLNEEMFSTALSYITGEIGNARLSSEITPIKVLHQEGNWDGPAIERVEKFNSLK